MKDGMQLGNAAQPGCTVDGAAPGSHGGFQNFDGSGQVTDEYLGRWRELFPLPDNPLPPVRQGVSTSSKRRSIRVHRQVEQANSIVECLNEMYCAREQSVGSPSVSLAQHDSQHAIYKQLNRFKSSSKPCTEQEAVQELLRTSTAYNGEETMNTVRPYDRDLVSLPGCGDEPIPLTQVMDEHGRELVKDPLAFMMRSSEEWGEMVERGETFQPYMDVRLQANPELYAGFVKDLVDKKMLDFTLKPGDLVTPFFVNKKNKKLRFILDCRGTNRRFRDPPPLALAAGSTWAQLEVDHSQKLFVAQSDIRDYFFSLELPPDLKHLFCLPPIPLQYLAEWGIQAPCDGAEDTRGWVWPRCRVVPMGWSWAMYIAQRVHQHICLEASGLGTSRLLVEGRPAPSLETGEVVLIPYADNLNVAGTCQAAVQRTKDCIVHRLRQHGFRVHEETEASTLAQSLGFLVDGERHCITPIPERWEKVLQAFGWLARRPRVSGKAVERLLGHAVHFAMLRRELLSIFRSLYDFVARSYNRRQRLWASAAKEAKWAQHLFKLCSVNMKRSWSASVTASDASLSGVAVCSRELPLRDVVRHGRIRETWRYVSGRPVKPREVVVDLGDPFEDPGTVKPVQAERSDPYELNFDFPDIEAEVMQKDCWTQCFAIHMQYPEHITLLEGRGVIAAMRHKFRSSQQFGRKHLHFTDNMGVVLLCSKGRSNAFGMLRVCRRLTCLLLATDSFLQVRWVPSERNVADQASRQWEHLRKHAFSPGGAGTEKEDAPYTSTWNPPSRDKVQPDTEKPKAVTSKTADQDPGRSEAEPLAGETRESDPAEVSRTDIFGADGSVKTGGRRLSATNAGLSPICPSPKSLTEDPGEGLQEIGRGLQLLRESHVRSRIRARRGHKVPRRNMRHVPRLWPEAHSCAHPAITAGMAEAGTPEDSTTSAVAVVGGSGHADVEATQNTLSSSSSPQLHRLPSPGRGSAPEKSRLGQPHASTEALVPFVASSRAARTVQGGPSGRKHPAGLSSPAMDRSSPQKSQFSGSLPPRHHLLRFGSVLAGSAQGDRTSEESRSALPTPSLRTFARQVLQATPAKRGEAERALASRQLSAEIRGACAPEPGVQRPPGSRAEKVAAGRADASKGGPKIFRPSQQLGVQKFVLEMFSGCARLSQACSAVGFISIAYDIAYGTACDVLQPAVLHRILRFLHKHQGSIAMVWLGTPCTTWSRARKHDGGPPPLRDDEQNLFGFDDLSFSDKRKIQDGNSLLSVSEQIISTCIALNLCWAIENPWSSRIWLTPYLKQLADRFTLMRIDFCAYHMPWRKATGILFGGPFSLLHLARECVPQHGRCSFSNRKHIVLVGKDSAGQWLTRRAQPYPFHLRHAIANTLTEHR